MEFFLKWIEYWPNVWKLVIVLVFLGLAINIGTGNFQKRD